MISQSELRKNILIVDDDEAVTGMLTMLLETRGYRVDVAQSGEEAFQKVSHSTDLILLDVVLPGQGGFDICRKLKENKNTIQIPIIILSGKLFSEDIVQGLYIGADDYLTKPFEYEELVARIEAVMRRGAVFQRKDTQTNGKHIVVKELKKIINEKLVVPFFQPIFLFKPLKLLGFEALCRARTKSMLANPDLLFKSAIQFGMYHELEMLSWTKAVEYASQYLTDEKLFLNCNPYLVEGPKFMTIKSLFDQSSIKVENVILEITERSAISDYKVFYNHLKRFREYGFKFAVDDVGGGYSSLESIVETHPEVVKIDRHIVRDLHADPFKRSIVKFIVAFCNENKILCVAEGIESRQDLDAVIELGVSAGQGYFLAKPTSEINQEEIIQAIEAINS